MKYFYRRYEPFRGASPPRWTELAGAESLTDAIGIASPLARYMPLEIGYGDGEAVASITTVTCIGEH